MSDQSNKPQCFVAMWFGSDENEQDQMNQLFDVAIKPSIEKHNLSPYRVDRDPAADKIDETILSEIEKSDLVIVDLTHDRKTGLRGSVIFEAGFSYRMKPVIWMCRRDLIDNIPFDIRQFKQIRWSANRLLAAKKELIEVIGVRFHERGKQSQAHEVKRLIAKLLTDLENAQDITLPDSMGVATADHILFVVFEEFCDDLDTRVKYKEMGLSDLEKYELIDMMRGFRKIVIDLPKSQGRVVDMNIYRNQVISNLQASGWLSRDDKR